MKQMKKAVLVLMVLVCAVALAACGGGDDAANDLPVIQPLAIEAENVAYAENATIRYGYPAADWELAEYITPLTIMYKETRGSAQAVNINAQVGAEFAGTLTETDLNELLKSLEAQAGYVTINAAELRSLNGAPVIYIDMTTAFTDEGIDLILENGSFTQADIDAAGGREALLAIPPVNQITVYAVADGHLCIYLGSYFDDAQKQACLDAITVMVDSTDVLQ